MEGLQGISFWRDMNVCALCACVIPRERDRGLWTMVDEGGRLRGMVDEGGRLRGMVDDGDQSSEMVERW